MRLGYDRNNIFLVLAKTDIRPKLNRQKGLRPKGIIPILLNSFIQLKRVISADTGSPGLSLQPQYPTLNRQLLKEHMQKGHVQEVHVLNVLSDGSP